MRAAPGRCLDVVVAARPRSGVHRRVCGIALAMAAAVSCALGARAVAEPRAADEPSPDRSPRQAVAGQPAARGAPAVAPPTAALVEGYPTALPDVLPAPTPTDSGWVAAGLPAGAIGSSLILPRAAGRYVVAEGEPATVEATLAGDGPAPEATAHEPAADGPQGPLDGLTPLRALGTCRYVATVALQEGDVDAGELRVLLEYSEEALAERLQVLYVDVSGEETVRVEEVGIAGRWYSYTGDPESPWTLDEAPSERDVLDYLGALSWLLDPRLLVEGSEAEASREEHLNGEAVVRYRFGEEAIRPEWLESMDLPPAREVSAEAWVSRDHGALAALEVTAACGAGAGSTQLVARGELSDVGGIVPVREPQICTARTLPEDVPLAEDATRLSENCGTWSYETPLNAEAVAEFYIAAMQERGWVLQEEESFAPAYVLFEREGTRLSVRTDGTGAATFVILGSTPAGEG